MEALITVIIAAVMCAATAGFAWEAGYKCAKQRYGSTDATEAFYNGYNHGYVNGVNHERKKQWKN